MHLIKQSNFSPLTKRLTFVGSMSSWATPSSCWSWSTGSTCWSATPGPRRTKILTSLRGRKDRQSFRARPELIFAAMNTSLVDLERCRILSGRPKNSRHAASIRCKLCVGKATISAPCSPSDHWKGLNRSGTSPFRWSASWSISSRLNLGSKWTRWSRFGMCWNAILCCTRKCWDPASNRSPSEREFFCRKILGSCL